MSAGYGPTTFACWDELLYILSSFLVDICWLCTFVGKFLWFVWYGLRFMNVTLEWTSQHHFNKFVLPLCMRSSQRVMLPKFLAKISPTCQNLGPFLSTFQTMGWFSAITRPFLVKISNSRGALGKAKKYGGKGSGSPESELEACVVCLSLPLFRKNNFPVIRLWYLVCRTTACVFFGWKSDSKCSYNLFHALDTLLQKHSTTPPQSYLSKP